MRFALLLGIWLLLGCVSEPTHDYTVTFPSLTVMPGVEKTQCVVLKLGNTEPVHIGQIHNLLSSASHHMIIYRVDDTVEQPVPTDCLPFVEIFDAKKGAPLMITQKKDELLNLPSGVVYTLAPNQLVRLEMHYINATTSPLVVSGSSTMTTSPTFHDEADFLFIGNPDLKIAAQSKFTLGPTFFPLDADTFGDANFFAFTGHEHHFGTGVAVQTAATADDSTGASVYAVPDWQWSEPETVMHDPPIRLPPNAGFKFTCDWNNTSNQTVEFGESANDEMCFFWAYYYPSKGSYVCIHTKLADGHDFCCPGAVECAFVLPVLTGTL